jgi:hypothetical protein
MEFMAGNTPYVVSSVTTTDETDWEVHCMGYVPNKVHNYNIRLRQGAYHKDVPYNVHITNRYDHNLYITSCTLMQVAPKKSVVQDPNRFMALTADRRDQGLS